MQAKRIHKPSEVDERTSKILRYNREAKKAAAEKDEEQPRSTRTPRPSVEEPEPESATPLSITNSSADRAWSVNAPVQDLRRFHAHRLTASSVDTEYPDVQQVLRLHGSVHDEIDVSIRTNTFPCSARLTRLIEAP